MPNEVEIRITAKDLTGPAFVGALARMKALQAATAGFGFGGLTTGLNDAVRKMDLIKQEVNALSFGKINTAELDSSLSSLKSKIQSLGIADIADVNVQPGRIFTQLQLLKRMIGQSGISDFLDVNVNDASLNKQLGKISRLTETIPVLFDVSRVPQFGPIEPIKVPVEFDTSNAPVVGPIMSLTGGDIANIDKASQSIGHLDEEARILNRTVAEQPMFWDGALKSVDDFNVSIDHTQNYFSGLGMLFHAIESGMFDFGGAVAYANDKLHIMAPILQGALAVGLGAIGAGVTRTALGLKGLNDNISRGIPLMQTFNGWWGVKLPASITLFGGALESVKIPAFLSKASGLHILIEGIVETLGTAVPAMIAFGTAIGAAIPTVTDISSRMKALYTVTDAFGAKIFPITGQLGQMADAVKPNVYVFFGEALQVVNSKSGLFISLAQSASKVLNDLGARFVYAITQSNTFGQIMSHASQDLQGWGNLIGNIGGIFGNLLKVLPGYAEMILNVLQSVTHGIELVTGSALGQWFLKIGLAAHGALFYIGLLGTGFAFLASKTLAGLATVLLNVAVSISGLGTAGAAASVGLTEMAIGAETAAALPWGWISIAAAGLAFLVYQLVSARDAANKFAQSVEQNVLNSSVQNLGNTLQSTLNNALQQSAAAFGEWEIAYGKAANSNNPSLAGKAQDAANAAANWDATVKVLQADTATYQQNLSIAAQTFGSVGAALAAMGAAGVTSTQFLSKSKQTFAEAIIEGQAYDQALKAVTQTTGRYGAAENALNFSLFDTANQLGFSQDTIQKYTQAQTSLLNVLLGGEQGFIAFQQAIQTTGTDAKVSGASIGGLNAQSLTLANDVYGTSVPALQSLISSLNLQEISTSNLTKVVATGAGQILQYSKNNTQARAIVVDLINNALGPGTVSLKNLNKWVTQNSTSVQGFQNIIAQTTIKASSLAGVLENSLNKQFQQEILVASGADQATRVFADALVKTGADSNATKSARDQLIRDLENAGFSARDATNFVNGLTNSLKKVPANVTTHIAAFASGSGTVTYQTTSQGTNGFPIVKGNLKFFHQGGLVGGQLGSMGPDDQLAAIRTGEFIVNPEATKRHIGLLTKINSYAKGGLVDPVNYPAAWVMTNEDSWGNKVEGAFMNASYNGLKNLVTSFIPPVPSGGGVSGPGPGGGTPAANVALARRLMPAWTVAPFWSDWISLWTRESGWNQFARNPGSGAYGIPQALPPSKMGPAANPPLSNPFAQEKWGIGYIAGRYGNPSNAWAHEVAMGWYDNGGWLKPGWTMAYNGTGSPEPVGNVGRDVHITIELGSTFRRVGLSQQELEDIRYTVRTIGGGSAQTAFGVNR